MNYNLKRLVDKSIFILREAKAQFKNPCVMWSTGKDSTATLSLCRDAFYSTIPFPVVHIDTGWKFPEMYEFRDKLAKEWNMDLMVAKSPKAGIINPTKGTDHKDCCTELKTNSLRKIIEERGFDAVLVSIRRDEHYIRNFERITSPRDKNMKWHLMREKTEEEIKKGTSLTAGDGDSPFISETHVDLWNFVIKDYGKDTHHVRVHPILPWTEYDVWDYIKERELPVNPLYFAKDGYRYRSLGCKTCTSPTKSNASTIDEIVEEIATTRIPERSGRAQDKEAEQVMRKLRALGYM